jgi:hypothetical protein
MNPVITHIYLTEIVKKAKEIMPDYLNAIKIKNERRVAKFNEPIINGEGAESSEEMQEPEPSTETQFD